jgi:hypothetical protein
MSIELESLSTILSDSAASPNMRPERIAPSAYYDLQYRCAIIAAAIEICGKSEGAFQKLSSARLRLFQFVAIRPWLLRPVREWSAARKDRQRSLRSVQSLRKGFLNDQMHDAVIDYMVAIGYLFKQKGQIASPSPESKLSHLFKDLEVNHLFEAERNTLHQLNEIVVTSDMLEGW